MSKDSTDSNKTQPKNSFITRITVTTICLIAAIWLLDPLIGSTFFTNTHYLDQLLTPTPVALYFRLLLSLLTLGAGYAYYRKVHHIQKQNKQLEQQKNMIQQIIDSEPGVR